jgi:hypothetical protein
MHNMFWCVSWCFMYCKYIRLLPTTRPYMSISLYQSIPTFVLLSPIHTYIHLQSLTHRFLSFLQFPALSIRDQPAPEGSTTTMINLCQPSSPCQVLGSLGPCLLFHNGCLLLLKLLSFHVRFRRTQCGNIAAKHWCESDFRNQS